MRELVFDTDRLILQFKGIDRVLALRKQIEIPYANIVSVERYNPDDILTLRTKSVSGKGGVVSFRGSRIYNAMYLGALTENGVTTFWDVRRNQEAVKLALQDHLFDIVHIATDSAEFTIGQINAAIKR